MGARLPRLGALSRDQALARVLGATHAHGPAALGAHRIGAAMARKFEDRPAVREATPLLIGLVGPSNSGKTFSALRLATGIQRVSGGDIWGIDTESRRMLHYADKFKFRHVPFGAPFGP